MLGKSKWLLATSLVLSMAMVVPVQAQSKKSPSAKAPTNQQLLERIEALESELSKQKESGKSTRAKVVDLEQRANDIQVDFKDSRPTFKTGDGRFTLALRARIQADYAHFMQSDPRNGQKNTAVGAFTNQNLGDLGSGANFRRVYFGIEGKAFNDFWYELRLNLGGSDTSMGDALLNRARIAYHGIKNFRVNVGLIQPMVTYGDTVSSGDLMFMERASINNLFVDNFGGAGNRKGVEFTFQKAGFFHGSDNLILNAAYTGSRTQANGNANLEGHTNGRDEDSNVLGRIAYRAYSNSDMAFQVGGSYGRVLNSNGTGNPDAFSVSSTGAITGTDQTFGLGINLQDRPEIRVSGSRLVSTGAMGGGASGLNGATAYGYDAQFQYKNFFVEGEYNKYEIDIQNSSFAGGNPSFSGWYVAASWILTGERKTYNANSMSNNYGSFGAPKVIKPFSLKGNSWGVWELAARYSTIDLNYNDQIGDGDTTAGEAGEGVAGGEQKIITLGVNWYLNNNVRFMLNNMIVNVERRSGPGGFNNFNGQNMNVIAGRLQFSM